MSTLTESALDRHADARAAVLLAEGARIDHSGDVHFQHSTWRQRTWTVRGGGTVPIAEMDLAHARAAWGMIRSRWLANDQEWARRQGIDAVEYAERIMRLTPLGQALAERMGEGQARNPAPTTSPSPGEVEADRRAAALLKPFLDYTPDGEEYAIPSRWSVKTWTTREGQELEVADMDLGHARRAWAWARDRWLVPEQEWAVRTGLDPIEHAERVMLLTPLGQALAARLVADTGAESQHADALSPTTLQDIRARLGNATTERRPTWWQERYAADVATLLAALDSERGR